MTADRALEQGGAEMNGGADMKGLFAHMGLACEDPIEIERFYTRHFGFERVRVVPLEDDRIVFIRSGGLCLELFKAKEDRPVPAAGQDGPWYPGWRHLAFTVEDVDAKLAAIGDEARISLGPLDFDAVIPGWRTAWILDPEGNSIEISQGYVDEDDPPSLEDDLDSSRPAASAGVS
jgi:glyoxylase I family protein